MTQPRQLSAAPRACVTLQCVQQQQYSSGVTLCVAPAAAAGCVRLQVLSALVLDLSGEHFVDPWDGVLKRFITSAAAVEAVCTQSSYADCTLKPATSDMQQRYPRDPRRLEELAAKLRDAGAGGVKGAAALRRRWEQQQERLRQEGQAAEGEGDWVAPSTNGSMPVVHLLASLRATDSLWAKLFK